MVLKPDPPPANRRLYIELRSAAVYLRFINRAVDGRALPPRRHTQPHDRLPTQLSRERLTRRNYPRCVAATTDAALSVEFDFCKVLFGGVCLSMLYDVACR